MSREIRMTISGQVQGVFFRAKTKEHADRIGLRGKVSNLSNGDVEICSSGTKKEADQLIEALKKESSPIRIDSVQVTESPSEDTYSGFHIIH